MKRISLLLMMVALMVLGNSLLFAQDTETESPFSLNVDLMSRYVWRGTDFNSSPSIQPGISYAKGGLTVGAWGAFTTSLNGIQETDLYASYTIKDMISITVTDYFFLNEAKPLNKYYNYNDTTTGHIIETSISFNGTEKIPLTFLLATNVWGADARKLNSDGSKGNIQYSTYAELGYTFKFLNAFLGFNLTNADTDNGESGFYGDSMGVVNLGITAKKKVNITENFNLPITVSLITNPEAERIYLVAGFSF